MNKIEFKIEEGNENHKYNTVRILIDGRSLISLLTEYETPFAKSEGSESLAGSYAELLVEELYENLTKKQHTEKVRLLDCNCGTGGCWPFLARITETSDAIIWSDFEQPFRAQDQAKFWDYSSFGNFTFSKAEYTTQVNSLTAKP